MTYTCRSSRFIRPGLTPGPARQPAERGGARDPAGRGKRYRSGAAIVEFAVLLPVVVSLLIGVWEIGRVTNVQDILTNAAREGARQAATGQVTNAQVQQVVIRYLASAGLPTGNVVVTVQDLTNPANDVSAAQYLDRIQVTVTIPFGDVRWATPSFFVCPTTLLTAQVQWGTMVDKAYPNPPQPPAG